MTVDVVTVLARMFGTTPTKDLELIALS